MAKRICAAMNHLNHLEVYRNNRRNLERFTNQRGLPAGTTVVKIPAAVHVIYHSESENISPEQVASQIAALNRDYRSRNNPELVPPPFRAAVADPLIEFALADQIPAGNVTTGITRKRTTRTSFPDHRFDPEATAKLDELVKTDEYGRSPWPADDYLNLWTCTLDGGLLGYAQFPGGRPETDGVVILNTAFGSTGTAAAPGNQFNQGRTAVHEIGHWLNLLHIWGDDQDGCTGSDNVADTPNQAGSNSSKPAFPMSPAVMLPTATVHELHGLCRRRGDVYVQRRASRPNGCDAGGSKEGDSRIRRHSCR